MCALRFIDSFDHYASGDVTEKYHDRGGGVIQAGLGRRGTACLATMGGEWVSVTLDAQPRWILGFAMRYTRVLFPTVAGGFCDVSFFGARHLGLEVTPEGFVRAVRVGTTPAVLGQSLQALHTALYYYIEVLFVVHPSAGEVVVRVDGVEWLHLTGVNTEAVAGVLPNQVRLGWPGPGQGGLYELRQDDLYICDGQGSGTFTTFLGDCRVDAIYPNADGTHTAWAPSAGAAHYALVDEHPPTDDTDYVSTSTGGARDSYQLEPLPTMPSPTVLAVQACINARKDDVDEILIAPLLVSGGVTSVAATVHELNASYKYALDLWTADPGTGGAWTEAAVNSLQVGMERRA